MAKKKTKTTRNTEFNYYKDSTTQTIDSVVSYTATNAYKNIRLKDVNDSIRVTSDQIIADAAANTTLKELGYNVSIDTGLTAGKTLYLFGAPDKMVLNNRQNYNNCGIESTLNNLAMAGIAKMKENLSDQKSTETNFLKSVWEIGLAGDSGVVGVLDKPDGGTKPDDYKDILKYFDINSEAYYISSRCDGIQYNDLNQFAYKISQGYGAIIGVCSKKLWQNTASETGEITIDHAITVSGVVYDTENPNATTVPIGFYVHDTGAWMTRYISLEEFKDVVLYDYQGVNPTADNYLKSLSQYDTKTETYLSKTAGGFFTTLTTAPIKTDTFNIDATGNQYNNIIYGNSGENIIKGLAGNDTLYGGANNDEIRGGAGNDVIFGNGKNDVDIAIFKEYVSNSDVQNRLNNTNYVKSAVQDAVMEGINEIYGDAGNDIIFGGNETDLIYGGNGNDYIYTGDGRNAVYAGKGNDIILGGYDNDRLFGDAGNDTIYGFSDDDVINGGAGNDTIYGGRGNDIIETGKGNDTVYFEGKAHGIDEISSEGGNTTLVFEDEFVKGDGIIISDMNFNFEKDKNNAKSYNLTIGYDTDDENNGVTFNGIYNSKNNKTQNVTIIDSNDETYTVKASNAKKVTVANTKTNGTNLNINNILFTTNTSGTKITTSQKDDIVYMQGSDNIKDRSDLSRIDNISYTGGMDKYVSIEGNTQYIVNSFDKDTNLAIYDNATALKKVKVDDKGKPVYDKKGQLVVDNTVVSEHDSIVINSAKNNLKFLFDVSINGSNKAITTARDGFFVLNGSSTKAETYSSIVKSVISDAVLDTNGFVYMDSFFEYDKNKETEFIGTDFYGNGRIEELYYVESNKEQLYTDITADLTTIASQVAGWLSTHATYNSAFDAFADNNIPVADLNALINCYTTAA